MHCTDRETTLNGNAEAIAKVMKKHIYDHTAYDMVMARRVEKRSSHESTQICENGAESEFRAGTTTYRTTVRRLQLERN